MQNRGIANKIQKSNFIFITLFHASQSLLGVYINAEAWNCKCHVLVWRSWENLRYRCSNSSPRYSVRTTMPSLYLVLKVSQVFKLQDKHNASSYFDMSWIELPQPKYKGNEIPVKFLTDRRKSAFSGSFYTFLYLYWFSKHSRTCFLAMKNNSLTIDYC